MKLRKLAVFLLASVVSCSALFTPVSARDVSNGSIPIKVEEYDYETNQVTEKSIYVNPSTSISSDSSPSIPDDPGIEPYGLIGTTDRRTKVNPAAAPYDGIALLRFDYVNGSTSNVGTGFLISPRVIVTAAHNIKNLQDQWCTNLKVTIANTSYPVDFSAVTKNWTANGHLVKDDYGVVVLSKDVTDATYFTLSTATPGNRTYTVAGYCFWDGGYNLYKHSGTVTAATDSDGSSVYRYKIDQISGQSGSPLYNSSNRVIGINAYELGGDFVKLDPNDHTSHRVNCSNNEAVRITSSIISFYNGYVSENQ